MKIQMLDPGTLVPYERNAKKHPKEQVEKIVKAILAAKGFDQPIVVDKNMVIIKGHGRRLAALQMGLKQVPVVVRDDLNEDEVRAARHADNRAGISDFDTEMLRLDLADIGNIDLLKGIFDDKELEFTMADLGVMNDGAFIPDLDAAVDAQEKATAEKAEAMKVAEVPLTKAMGFKSIPGADEIHLTRFLAQCEQQSGLKGRDAFLAFIRLLTAEVSQ